VKKTKMKTKNILGNTISYIKRDFEKEGLNYHGLYVYDDKTIYYNSKSKNSELKHTILHEEIHAICHALGLYCTGLSRDVEEILAEKIPDFILKNYNISEK